jgi:hypothetical protein
VTARKGGADIAEGTKTGLVITSGGTTSESITLEPKTGTGVANGTFSYTITLPTGAEGTLTITTASDGPVTDGTKDLTGGATANTGTVSLPPGEYRLAVSLTKDGKPAGFKKEVVYSYSTLISAFARVFTDEDFEKGPDLDPETGTLDLTITIAGQGTIPLGDTGALSFEQGAETTFTLSVVGSEFTDINWYLDEEATAVGTSSSYTPASDLSVKKHLVTVNVVKNGKNYSEIVEFTVTAGVSAVPAGFKAIDSAVELAKSGVDGAYPLDGKYFQTADFSISNPWTPIGSSSSAAFTGEYDGNGKVITPNNVTIDVNSSSAIFGYASGAEFKNIKIGQGSITMTETTGYNGGIVGEASNTTKIINCSNEANLTGMRPIGGICGQLNSSSSITGCWNTGDITGTGTYAGGICGYVQTSSIIQNSYNSGGQITVASGSGQTAAGGIAGYCMTSAKIIACYNTGDVMARTTGTGVLSAGGISGATAGSESGGGGSITACYNTGAVSSDSPRTAATHRTNIGGISGNTSRGNVTITASYSTGTVSYAYTGADNKGLIYIGGISGYNAYNEDDTVTYPVITACYWKTTDDENGIGFNAQTEVSDNTGTLQFSGSAWPATSTHTEWGIGDGSGSGKYWESLGGGSVYPRLWFEQ